MNALLEKIQNFDDFPTLPTIYYKLVDALSNTSTTIKDLSNLISTDIALSVKLLKIVNSSIYGLSTKVSSIDKAIFHLGFRELKNIILSTKIIEVFSQIDANTRFDIVEFWKHSIGVGAISRVIGQKLGQKNLDEYLLAGITHDIGKLVLYKILGNEYNVVFILMSKENISLLEAEKRVLGITHQEIGLRLAENWNLDGNIKNVIRFHNDGLMDNSYDQLVAVVNVANSLAKVLEYGDSGCKNYSKPNPLIWRRLNITDFDKVEFYNQISTDYNQAKEILILK